MKNKKVKPREIRRHLVEISPFLLNKLPRVSTKMYVFCSSEKIAVRRMVKVIHELVNVNKLIKKYKIETR